MNKLRHLDPLAATEQVAIRLTASFDYGAAAVL
jgi:hypothetical protein